MLQIKRIEVNIVEEQERIEVRESQFPFVTFNASTQIANTTKIGNFRTMAKFNFSGQRKTALGRCV